MHIVLDILLVAVAAFCIINGYRKGFVKSLMDTVTGVASLLAAYAMTPNLAAFFKKSFILESLSKGISDLFASISENGANSAGEAIYDLTKLLKDSQVSDVLSRFGADSEKLAEIISDSEFGTIESIEAIAGAIAEPIANAASNILAFVVIFIVAIIVLKIVTSILCAIFKLPVLNSVNKTAGVIFGCICALFFVWVLSTVISIAISLLSIAYPSDFSVEIIEKTILLEFFAKYNLITVLFAGNDFVAMAMESIGIRL